MRLNFPKSSAVVMILVGATALGGCATKGFVREQIATVNTRIDGMDGRLRTRAPRARHSPRHRPPRARRSRTASASTSSTAASTASTSRSSSRRSSAPAVPAAKHGTGQHC
jgi:hypothetical protein